MDYWHPYIQPNEQMPGRRIITLPLPWGETRSFFVPVYWRANYDTGEVEEFNGRPY